MSESRKRSEGTQVVLGLMLLVLTPLWCLSVAGGASLAWGWYAVPLGAPAVPFGAFMAAVVVRQMVVQKFRKAPEDTDSAFFIAQILVAWLFYAPLLGLAWVLR